MEIVLIGGVVVVVVWLMVRRSKRSDTTDDDAAPGSSLTYQAGPGGQVRQRKWISKEEADEEFVRHNDGSLGVRVAIRDELRFVSASSGLQAAPGNLALARLGLFYFHARGAKYYDDVVIRTGSQVHFKREPDNPHGDTAIALADPRTGAVYGYVNKGFSRRISKRLDAGEDWVAISTGRDGITVAMMPRSLARELGLVRS